MALCGIVLGTGPSLAPQIEQIRRAKRRGKCRLFLVNNTWMDFPEADAWIACDPDWHRVFSPITGDFDKYHWSREICDDYGYQFIEGRWFDGLSTDPSWISYNHCSSAQALNLALHYGCDPLLLVGHDFSYDGKRHYFDDLSDTAGEYPPELRKFSTFGGLKKTYQHIADQEGLPPIYNATPGSALKCFPAVELGDFI